MVRWFESNDEIVAQIPVFLYDGNETQAIILAVEYNNKLKFRLIVRDKFEKYKKNKKPKPTVQKIKDLFIIFDFQENGKSSYLPEGRIINISEIPAHLKNTAGDWEEVTNCYLVEVYSGGEIYSHFNCETDYIWYPDELSDNDEGGGVNPEPDEWYNTGGGEETPSCDPGYTLDKDGNCVKIPCTGNPINNIEIAPQTYSGLQGAMFGCNRKNSTTICGGIKGLKYHDGIDLKTSYGDPIFAMFDGSIYSTKYDPDGMGYYTRIISTVNGKVILVEYGHMQENNRRLQTDPDLTVKAGDIIGYQGLSGNLGSAIEDGYTSSHVHIKIRLHDDNISSWSYQSYIDIDPREYLTTTINDDGSVVASTDCN